MSKEQELYDQVNRLKWHSHSQSEISGGWTFLSEPLTSTSWDGDAFSTTGKTVIDLSAVFGVPAGVKAVFLRIACRDSGSSGASTWFGVSATNTASEFAVMTRCGGVGNDYYIENSGYCPCDINGDVYYQCAASGAGTLDVVFQVWGYYI